MRVRVRLNHGVVELPEGAPAVTLSEEAVISFRTQRSPPAGAPARLGEVDIGAAVSVDGGGSWDEGIVLGRTIRPVLGGRYRVDGDLVDYDTPEAAVREHGPLDLGEPLTEPQRAGEHGFELGEPLTRRELAGALDCETIEVDARAATLDPKAWSRAVSRAFAFRPDPASTARKR